MFSPEHEQFRQSLRRFVAQEMNPQVEKWEADRQFNAHELFPKLGALGALGPSYPEEYGGGGGDYLFNLVLAEELGRCDCMGVPMAILVQTDMATPALAQSGSEELKKTFLEGAIAGTKVAAIAVSEPDAGSDVARLRTTAIPDGDDFVINGSKMWITNGAQADFLTLLARTTPGQDYKGMSLIVVPTDLPGFSVSRKIEKMGNWASDTAVLSFDNMRVPRRFCIGDEGRGFQVQMKQFEKERLMGATLSMAAAENAVRRTQAYCKERQVFGKALLDNQYIHYKLAELLTELEALKQLIYFCAREMTAGRTVTREVSMAKLKAGRTSREVADTCVQFHGGMGYAEEYPMARYFRDARLMSIGAGADEVMLGVISKIEGMA